jgi:hydroxypyruvate isomerase
MITLAANLTMLFGEVPFLERCARARADRVVVRVDRAVRLSTLTRLTR